MLYHGLEILGGGAILTGLVLGAIAVFIIERKFAKAAAFALAGAVLTYFGFMHGEAVGIGRRLRRDARRGARLRDGGRVPAGHAPCACRSARRRHAGRLAGGPHGAGGVARRDIAIVGDVRRIGVVPRVIGRTARAPLARARRAAPDAPALLASTRPLAFRSRSA